jgi:uncharacterized SAM-binding protein YcdF (DUF218 family)
MNQSMRDLLAYLVLPPFVIYVGLGLGCWLLWRKHRAGLPLILTSFGVLYALSLPLVSGGLMKIVEAGVSPFDPSAPTSAGAIVILSAGLQPMAPEYETPAVDGMTLERLRYGAHLHRITGLPVLVSGGTLKAYGTNLADAMAESLRSDFAVEATWLERRSMNTKQNAVLSAALLKEAEVSHILLVTHAWHMSRSVSAFERAGLMVTQAPHNFESRAPFKASHLLPSAKALHNSYYAVHELIGRFWYWIVG